MLDAELNQTRGNLFWSWWMTIDRYMLAATFIIIAFSIIMVTTASPAVAERIGLHSFYFIQRQLVYLFLGVTIMLGISFRCRRYKKNIFYWFYNLFNSIDISFIYWRRNQGF